jgi:hypothetical protein
LELNRCLFRVKSRPRRSIRHWSALLQKPDISAFDA